MALVECPECHKAVSSLATSCPVCGCPIAGNAAPKVELEMSLDEAKSKIKSVQWYYYLGYALLFFSIPTFFVGWAPAILLIGMGVTCFFFAGFSESKQQKYIEKHFGKVIDKNS